MTPQERILRSRLGALVLHSGYDSRALTAPARAAFLAKFEREVDPDGELSVPERKRRADMARRAYFTRLALKSVQRRSKKTREP